MKFNIFKRTKKVEPVFSYDTFALDGQYVSDENIALGEQFVTLLCIMARVHTPDSLPVKYISRSEVGNVVKVYYEGKIVDVRLTGCDVAEFLVSVQITRAGLEVPWSPMKRPGYWSMEQYNTWVAISNPVIAESCK